MATLGERWIRNLLVSRQLLERAAAADDRTEAGAIIALLLADLAVETAGKTAITYRPPRSHPGNGYLLSTPARRSRGDPSFPAVLDDILASWRLARADDSLSAVEIAEAMRLHRHRNVVQHDAVVPRDATRDVTRAEACLEWIVPAFFGIELSEVSRATLIRDDEARGRVLLAENAAEAGDFRTALAQLRVAFEYAIRSRDASRSWTFFESEIDHATRQATGTEYGPGQRTDLSPTRLKEVLTRLHRRVAEMDDIVQATSVGADPVEFAWFARNAPVPSRTMNSPFWTIFDDQPRSREDYLRAYEFVVSTLLRWQQLPPIEKTHVSGRRPGTRETVLPNPPKSEAPADPPAE